MKKVVDGMGVDGMVVDGKVVDGKVVGEKVVDDGLILICPGETMEEDISKKE